MPHTTLLDAVIDCIAYTRVSTERQAGEVYTSPKDQERAVTALAERLKKTIQLWFRDLGASGATVEGRPAFREMLAFCEAHPRPRHSPGLVLVLNDSRFGRFPDPDEAAALRYRFKRAGWIVRFAEGDDTEDVTFRAVIRSLGSAQASEYRRNIQRNARRGMKGAAEQGYWTRRAPYGYRRVVVYPPEARRVLEGSARKAPTEKISLVVHEPEAAIVRWMFEAYASGAHTLGTLMAELTTRAPQARTWKRPIVRQMLMNPTYLGDVVGGRRTAERVEQHLWSQAPESEWYGKRDAHPALVTRELFAVVQARLAENARLVRAPRTTYLLTGLVRCPHCGCVYAGGGTGGRTSAAPDGRYRFYKCNAQSRGVACPGSVGTVARHLLERAVLDTLAKEIARPAMRRRIEQAIDEAIAALQQGPGPELAKLAREAETLTARRDRLVSLMADGTVTRAEGAPQLAELRISLERIASYRASLEQRASQRHVLHAQRDRLVQQALDFPAVAARLEGAELRALIRPWLAAASFDKETRVLTMQIRHVPALAPFRLSHSPGQTNQQQSRVITRRVTIVGNPGALASVQARRARGVA